MQASIQGSERYPSLLTIIVPIIGTDMGGVPIQITSAVEGQVPILDVLCTFCGVILDIHYLIVGTINQVSRST